jgi:hypothetical protein
LIEPQRLNAIRGHGNTDQPSGRFHHEVDHLRGRLGRGKDNIPFIFTGLIIGDDDHAAFANVLEDLFRCIEHH